MRLKLTAIVLILLIVSIISGCAQLKEQLGRIEAGVIENRKFLSSQKEELEAQRKELQDLGETANSVRKQLAELENNLAEAQSDQKTRFDNLEKKIADINKQLDNCQQALETGNRSERENAEKVINDTIEECKDNCRLILTVKKGKTINIRSGPSIDDKIAGVLKGGEKVTLVEIKGNWGRIKGDEERWCTILHYWTQLKLESTK